jgi:predicted phosphodiesterase
MKIAVLSDIHGNLPALLAVTADVEAWHPDLVVIDGDIVNRGPRSSDCLHFVQERHRHDNWQVIRGNHEDFVIACGLPDSPQNGPEYEIWQFAHWSYQQLNGDVNFLSRMPGRFSWHAPDGSEFRVLHASMRGNRDGIHADTPESRVAEQIAPGPAVFVTAHTHRPWLRRWRHTLLVNVGSVGAPFDRDRRASYGRFIWDSAGWQAEVVRLEYDRLQTERDYLESGFLDGAGPLAQLMLVELRSAHGLIYRWADKYQDAVLAGEIRMEASVRELLYTQDLLPFLGQPGWSP